MCSHEEKKCPRCGETFECKPGSIMQCQCSSIQFTEAERMYVESEFNDCLCINCLVFLQKEYAVIDT